MKQDNANMQFFPIFVDMKKAHVLVFGHNEAALQKIRLLLKTPATIYLFHSLQDGFNSSLVSALQQEYANQTPDIWLRIRHVNCYSLAHYYFADFTLVYQAGDEESYSPEEEAYVENWLVQARNYNVLINTVDVPDKCAFFTPSIVDRAPLTVAIGSEGVAPILGQMVKTMLEKWLPKNLPAYLRHAKSLRPMVLDRLPASSDRRKFWRTYYHDNMRALFYRNKDGFDTKIEQLVSQHETHAESKSYGHVSFVGAGPGEAELLTLKALQKLQQADVIIYDRLVNDDILEYARRDAMRINVGKTPGSLNNSQDKINEILINQAKENSLVVRLKGGDPLIFGRISEEINQLNMHNISYDIVPGITSAIGCAASQSMALTNRESHHGIIILSGHSQDGMPEYDWKSLAKLDAPIVFYMGVKNASAIRDKLVNAGLDLDTAVTIIENGLRDNEKVIISDAHSYINAMAHHKIKGPALIYIGIKPMKNSAVDMGIKDDSNVFNYNKDTQPHNEAKLYRMDNASDTIKHSTKSRITTEGKVMPCQLAKKLSSADFDVPCECIERCLADV